MKKKFCTEVIDILNFLGNEYKQQIPIDLLNEIKANIDTSYLKKLSEIEQHKKDDLYMEDTIAMIAFLNLKYWCKTPKIIKELRNTYIQNDRK